MLHSVFRFRGYRCLHTTVLRASISTTRPASTDDISLTLLFDQPITHHPSRATGILQHPLLQNPTQFRDVASSTLSRAQRLVDRILRARSSRTEMLKVVKNLDRLSDMLCNVIDLAELVRNAHPDPSWANNANNAYEMLCEFMNVLNTHVLKDVLADPTIVNTLSKEAFQTALIFWRDFGKSGIDLSPAKRDRFVSLSTEILTLGRAFLNGASAERPPVSLGHHDVLGKRDGRLSRLKFKNLGTPLAVRPGSAEAQLIMQSPSAETARQKLYVAANSSTEMQINVLERLLRARAELSNLVGRQSFAHMTLEDKMAKSPENVIHFLETRLLYMQPRVSEAIRSIARLKQTHMRFPKLPDIYAWDREAFFPRTVPSPPIPLPALTAGRAFLGLSRLFTHLYGISLRPAETSRGEIWHEDVRKLEVVDEDAGIIGWLYVDLYHRENKASGAAHYTVVCSRRTDDDDEQGDFTDEELRNGASVCGLRDALPFNRHTVRGLDGTYQLPVAVLMFDFSGPRSGEPLYLDWQEVLTLCHEMGHAMHSMLGRTQYHNVSGTRCATDFVELPSILMEHFLTSPEVLSLFADPCSVYPTQLPSDPTHAALDDHAQILLGLIDQVYHSEQPLDPAFNSTAAFAELQNTKGAIPYVPGTSWQTQFGHLYGYGATYYSYMLDRAIAGRVWEKLFRQTPLDRDLGEKFKREVLSHGGAKDPWAMVSKLLNAPELEQGDAEAMKEVGRWKIDDEGVSPTMSS